MKSAVVLSPGMANFGTGAEVAFSSEDAASTSLFASRFATFFLLPHSCSPRTQDRIITTEKVRAERAKITVPSM
jgi:hypothetical protein